MNPLLAQALVSALTKLFQGGMTAAFSRPSAALPLDYTAEARGQTDRNREYLVSLDEQGVGVTNRGRTLLPADARSFLRSERGPEDWQRRRADVARRTPRTRGWEARITPPDPSLIGGRAQGPVGSQVIANAPGEYGVPVVGDVAWALHRLRQAAEAGLIGEIPTPADRDLPQAWRDTSARLAEEARRGRYSLSGRLEGRLEPGTRAALAKALRGVW